MGFFCNKNRKKDPRRKILKQIMEPRNHMKWLPKRDWLPSASRYKGGVIVYTDLRYVKRWKQ
jgi:hypothetical protein